MHSAKYCQLISIGLLGCLGIFILPPRLLAVFIAYEYVFPTFAKRLRSKQTVARWYVVPIASGVSLNASELQTLHGDVLGMAPLADAPTPFMLHAALVGMSPPITVTYATVRTWWSKYKLAIGTTSVATAQALEDQHGDSIRHLTVDNATAYKLCKALRERSPPLFVSDGVAKQWLSKFGGQSDLKYVNSAGHLELWYGDRIRASDISMQSDALANWLFTVVSAKVPVSVCQKWLSTVWSSSGRLLTPAAVEEALGDRMRLDEYKHCFADDTVAEALTLVLAEGQPRHVVAVLTLRQWYVKYHPASGPVRFGTINELETAMGDELRMSYRGLSGHNLALALGQRPKAVLVSRMVCRNWLHKYETKR